MKKIIKTFLALSLMISFLSAQGAMAAGPAPVDLLSAANFVLLTKTGITNTGSHTSNILGNIGSSPITAAAMNGIYCPEITGTIYGVDAAYVGNGDQTCFAGNPPASNKTLVDNAVLDMGTAYGDAVSRTLPDATELYAGNISGQTFTPGLYKWSSDVLINSDVTLSGGPNDVWIFQIAGNLNVASGGSVPTGVKVLLQGGAKASNVFWQVGGVTGATLGTYSTFNGNILSAKAINLQTGAVLNGRGFADTQITLDANPVSVPPNSGTGHLQVTSIDIIDGSATANGNFEDGWEYLFHITLPSHEPDVAMKFSNWLENGDDGVIPAGNNMRISSLQADNDGADVMITAADTYSADLHTNEDLDPSLEGIQIEVTVEVRIPSGTPPGTYTTSYGVRSS